MDPTKRIALRTILSNLYPAPRDAARIVADAGLAAARIDISGAPATFWHAVLVEAEHHHAVERILDIARAEYPANVDLAHWTGAASAGGSHRPPVPATPPIARSSTGTGTGAAGGRVRIYISCCPSDEKYRDELLRHLTQLCRDEDAEVWHAGMLVAGTPLDERDRRALDAHIAVLLLSADYLGNESTYQELGRIIASRGRPHPVPVRVRPVLLPKSLTELKPLPRDNRPVSAWSTRDDAWLDVVEGIGEVIRMIRMIRAPV